MPLSSESDVSEWIHHFVHSDNPRFKGKSKEERIQMALGAYYGSDGAVVMALDKEFSSEKRKELAKSGKAMPGGRYPIENESDLKNAIQAFGRAKNKAATKAWIKKRAAALGKTDLLPESWDALPDWIVYSVGDHDPKAIREVWNATEVTGDLFDRRGRNNGDDDQDDDEDDDDDEDYGDARTVQLKDEFLIDAVRKTKDGYLTANARIARTGIQLYAGDEVGRPDMAVVRVYRSPEEVFSKAAMHSLAHRPITLNHPSTMVDAANWKQHAIGQTGDEVTRDGDCVRVPMVIMDAKAVEQYEKYGVRELSVGYGCELKWGQGKTADGEVYDAKQTAIRGNHLAVVPAARGGSRLRIGDERGASDMKVLIDGQSIEFQDELVAKHVGSYIAQLQKQITDATDAKKKNGDDDDDADDVEEERKKVTAERDAAKGEILALKKQLEDANTKLTGKALDEIVKERTELILKADAVMEGKADFNGKEPNEIRRIVVAAQLGDAAKTLTDAEVVGAFKALTANVKPRTGTDRLADSLSLLQLGGGSDNNNPKAIKDAAYGDYVKSLTSGWRGTRTAS